MIVVNLDVMMAKRKMSLNELSKRVGISPQNMSILKNARMKSISIATLNKLCYILECKPADLFEYVESVEDGWEGEEDVNSRIF